jgi:hypothetical protein
LNHRTMGCAAGDDRQKQNERGGAHGWGQFGRARTPLRAAFIVIQARRAAECAPYPRKTPDCGCMPIGGAAVLSAL